MPRTEKKPARPAARTAARHPKGLRPVPSFPGYLASPGGDVFADGGGKDAGPVKLKPWLDGPHGYLRVTLRRGGRRCVRRVHQVVLEAFAGPCPEGMEARHLNGKKTDNRARNLRWGTPAENAADRRRHGRQARFPGTANAHAKLTDEAVIVLRAASAAGVAPTVLARAFGVTRKTVYDVLKRNLWKHVKG